MGLGSLGSIHDLGNKIKVVALQAQSGVAAGTGDNTEVTSGTIDRQEAGAAGYMAAVVALAYKTTLAAAETLKYTLKIQESDDGTNWDTAVALITTETQQTGVQTAKIGQRELSIDLAERKRYIRFLVTVDLSAGATDIFVWAATIVLGGADRLPV